jgi:hypothetical protein
MKYQIVLVDMDQEQIASGRVSADKLAMEVAARNLNLQLCLSSFSFRAKVEEYTD